MDLTLLAGPRGVPGLTTSLFPCRPAACPEDWSRASPVNNVDAGDTPMLLINSTDELVPLNQAQVMADRLRAAGVEHRLDVIPGTRHAHGFRNEVWRTTVDFLETSLASPPGRLAPAARATTERPGGDGSSWTDRWTWGKIAWALAVGLAITVFVDLLNRRRRRASS